MTQQSNIKANFSAYLRVLPKISSAILLVSLVAGCGGGGSGGDSGRTAFVQEVQDPIVQEVQDPIVQEQAVPSTVFTESPLSQLYGRVLFTHSFNSSEKIYIYDGVFGPENLVGDDFDDLSLINTFDVLAREDQNSEFESYSSQRLICGYLELTQKFFCNVFFDSGAVDNFLFDALVDNESFGTYEYCTSELSTRECTEDLVGSPDGQVLVSVISNATASPINLTKLDLAKKSPNGGSIAPYLEYENQGTLGSISNRSYVNSEFDTSLLDAFEDNKAKAGTLD